MASELARPHAACLSAARPGCAGRARNPKGPQVTPFCHQMGRHPTIWDLETGTRRRIPARISPWGSRGLNPNFCLPILYSKNANMQISGRFSNLCGTHRAGFGAPRGPLGPLLGGALKG